MMQMRKNAKDVEKVFKNTVDKLEEWKLLDEMKFQQISIEWIKGTERVVKRGKEYLFYTDKVLAELEKKITKQVNGRMSILLDVVLTRQEQEGCNANIFTGIELSRKIYDWFEEKCNLYLITGLRSFGTQAWRTF